MDMGKEYELEREIYDTRGSVKYKRLQIEMEFLYSDVSRLLADSALMRVHRENPDAGIEPVSKLFKAAQASRMLPIVSDGMMVMEVLNSVKILLDRHGEPAGETVGDIHVFNTADNDIARAVADAFRMLRPMFEIVVALTPNAMRENLKRLSEFHRETTRVICKL